MSAANKHEEQEVVAHSGWLTKRGAMKKSFKRRFFTLDVENQKMRYYKKEVEVSDTASPDKKGKKKKKKKQPIACVNLRVYEHVSVIAKETHDRDFEFSVSSPGLRVYYLIADSEDERVEWMNAFKSMGMTEVPEGEEQVTTVHHKGWLYKLGEFNRSPRRRFFVISGCTVSYHESEDDAIAGRRNGQFNLRDYESISLVPEEQFDTPFMFAISAPFRRVFYLSATSEEEMGIWIEAFLRAARLRRSDDIASVIDRNTYRLIASPDEHNTFYCKASHEPDEEEVVVPDDARVRYVARIVGGRQKFFIYLAADTVSFVSRSTTKSFPLTQIYSYDFRVVDDLPTVSLHPRIPGTSKVKVYKMILASEAIMHHMRSRLETLIALLVEKRKLYTKATTAYAAADEGELSVEVGDKVTVVKDAGNGMLLCRRLSGTSGVLPSNVLANPNPHKKKKKAKESKRDKRLSQVPVQSLQQEMREDVAAIRQQEAERIEKEDAAPDAGGDANDAVGDSSSSLDSSDSSSGSSYSSSSSYSGSSSSSSSS